jgi:high-affinity Fe2+/Pb2+ permease
MKIISNIKKIHKVKMLSFGAHSPFIKKIFWCGVFCSVATAILIIIFTNNLPTNTNRMLCVMSLVAYFLFFFFGSWYNIAWRHGKKISSFVERILTKQL